MPWERKSADTKYWLHDRIQNGHIQIVKDATTGVYLFPDHPTTLEQLRQLQAEPSTRVSFTAPSQRRAVVQD